MQSRELGRKVSSETPSFCLNPPNVNVTYNRADALARTPPRPPPLALAIEPELLQADWVSAEATMGWERVARNGFQTSRILERRKLG